MGDFKLRLSDIFRYIVLGAVQASLCYIAVGKNGIGLVPDALKTFATDPVVILVIALSIFYLSGFLTQMVLQLFCKGNLMGTGLTETGLFIKRMPAFILNRNRYPHWMYYSKRPDKVLGIYKEIMSVGDDSDVKTEYLYANNLFQGIALSLVVFAFFEYNDMVNQWNIMYSFATVVGLCVLGVLSVNWKWALIVNKLMMVLVPVLIIWIYYVAGHLISGLLIGGGIFLCLCIAEQLSRRHIRRIDVLIKYDRDEDNERRFLSTLKRNGLPRAFVLTRVSDSSYEYYREQLDSIKNQIYPNISVVVLIDRNSGRHDDFVKIIDEYRQGGLDISHYTSEGSGPACLAYEIRDIFLNYAGDDDVAISLDGDDLFASIHVVSRIMGRMARTEANVCLLTFAIFGDTRLNFAKNYPNEVVRNIAEKSTERGKALTPSELIGLGKAHLISTIGWTKCYRRKILDRYQHALNPYVKDMAEFTKYEDFPDIVALLDKESRICAVGHTSILFRKHAGSVTTSVSSDNYSKHITYYLKLARVLSAGNTSLADKAAELISRRFIPYKFVQYLNIVRKKTTGKTKELAGYSAKAFYDKFVAEVYGPEADSGVVLKEGMMEILRENRDCLGDNHAGYYGRDLPEALLKEDVSFKDIEDAYQL
ncbi:MAG: glycosyltransferase family 2 protein [Muribaculaceae bacterium]|nr:glycosyltransferase family 2 protein [Muribaculaceae bacterium]